MSIHSTSCLCSPYSFPKSFCFCSIRRLYPLTYFQDVCKNVPGYCGIFCCFEISSVIISFCFSGFCCFLCFSTFITKGKLPLFNSYFWSSNSFSLVLSFFHRPTIHLFNRDPVLICWHYSIFFFSRMVSFQLSLRFLRAHFISYILKTAFITFLHCVMSMIFISTFLRFYIYIC